MSEVIKLEPRESTAITPMEMIDRALTNGAQIETLDKLMDLQERWQSASAKSAYDSAMAEMQQDLPVIERTKKGHNYKYADWGMIKEQVQPALSKYGFAITHRTKIAQNGVIVTAICSHRDGHREETEMELPFDKSGSKNDVQARGSSIEYGKRYTGCAILGIAMKDEITPDSHEDGSDDYNITPWLDRIKNADKPTLLKIGEELKATRDIPKGALTAIRNAYSARLKSAPNRERK